MTDQPSDTEILEFLLDNFQMHYDDLRELHNELKNLFDTGIR